MESLIKRFFTKQTPKSCLELSWDDEAISLPQRSITLEQLHRGIGVKSEDLPSIYQQLILREFSIFNLLGKYEHTERFRMIAIEAAKKVGCRGTDEESFVKSIPRELSLENFSIEEVRNDHRLWCLTSADYRPFAPAFSKLAFSQAEEIMPLGGHPLGIRPVIIVQEAVSLTYEDVKNESAARSVRIGRIVVFPDEEFTDRFADSPHNYLLDKRQAH